MRIRMATARKSRFFARKPMLLTLSTSWHFISGDLTVARREDIVLKTYEKDRESIMLSVLRSGDQEIKVAPLGGRIGARVSGINLSAPLRKDTITELREALVRYKVVFIRDQHNLNDAQQEHFAQIFGELLPHPNLPMRTGTTAIVEFDGSKGGRDDRWHTDMTYMPTYPAVSVLRAVIMPPAGGDTIWSNTAAAYKIMPEAIREFADKLWAIHSNQYDDEAYCDYTVYLPNVTQEEVRAHKDVFVTKLFETKHPIVRVHPKTGERALVLGCFLKRIIGFGQSASDQLQTIFQSYVDRPENQIRWSWLVGDVAIWDNMATQHYAVNDYSDAARLMHRVTIAGDRPISVGGERSKCHSNNDH